MASKIKTSSIYAFFDIVAFFMATQSALSAPQPVKIAPTAGTVTLHNIHSGSLVYATKILG